MCFSQHGRAILHVFSQQPPPHPPLYRGYFSTQPTHKSLKNTAFRGFPNISQLWIFFLLTFAQLTLLLTLLLFSAFSIFGLCFSILLFQLSILSEVRLLNFLRPSRHPKRFLNAKFQKTQGKQTQTNKGNICGTKILGTQLLRTTQMCQGSTCHVVAQHGDISKLKKALLLTWEVCATIAIRYHQGIQRDFSMLSSKKHKANKRKPTKATFVAQRFLGHNC